MTLQIHDELVFEAPLSEVESVTKLINSTMENIIALDVPIKVDISHGDNWQEIQFYLIFVIPYLGCHLLATFLKAYYGKPYAFLAELADFEWKMTLPFDAQDKKVITLEEIAAVPADAWAELYFLINPSVQRVNYFWNAIPLWQTLIADTELPEIQKELEVKPWVLWRGQDYIIQYYSLSKEESWMFDGMQQGLSFGALCEGLCEWIEVDKVAMSAASYLKNWVQKGMLADLKFSIP